MIQNKRKIYRNIILHTEETHRLLHLMMDGDYCYNENGDKLIIARFERQFIGDDHYICNITTEKAWW